MLRSLQAGISGLAAHQTKLDVTANNIANVNTTGFKSSSTQFQDTMSQVLRGAAGAQPGAGGTNPAQIGLGVQVAGIATNFTQGAGQATGRATDLMLEGDGFFTVQKGDDTLYTRAGSFDFDSLGRMVAPGGAFVQGWTARNGAIDDGTAIGNITLPVGAVSPAKATTESTFGGNLPSTAATGTELVREIDVFDNAGNKSTLDVTFTKTAAGWDVGDGSTVAGSLTFVDGVLTNPAPISIQSITVDVTAVTGFADLNTLTEKGQDGNAAGTLETYSIGPDGTVFGSFSNGKTESIARVAVANFANPAGLEKAGGSTYRTSANTGAVNYGTAGQAGFGGIATNYLEMSNVDLSQEFTSLIVAQRGFQANARIITTSDEVLTELTNLKR